MKPFKTMPENTVFEFKGKRYTRTGRNIALSLTEMTCKEFQGDEMVKPVYEVDFKSKEDKAYGLC